MMQVDLEKCTGCGQCLEICSVGAISLVKGNAVIDPDTCISCGKCVNACPQGAISEVRLPAVVIPTDIQPARMETSKPVPAAWPGSRLAWGVPVITFIGREIIPRLADTLLGALDRRLSASSKKPVTLDIATARPARGQERQARWRRRGRMS